MVFSFALLLFSCLAAGWICRRLSLPPLFGYILCGVVFGPYALNLVDAQMLDLSAFLRKIALIIILMRAGLGMNLDSLKKNGASALMLCFVPATFEIIGYICLCFLLQLDVVGAAVLGCVMAAVSPAVVVPRMLKIDQEGYGVKHGIAQTIMAGASMDDIYVITLFTAFSAMAASGSFSWMDLLEIPVSAVIGIAAGWIAGWLLKKAAGQFQPSSIQIVLELMAFSLLFTWIEDLGLFPFASLLAVVVMAMQVRSIQQSGELRNSFSSLWVWGEMVLFFLVGTLVNPQYLGEHLALIVIVMVLALVFRAAGVLVSLIPSKFTWKEKLFCVIAYLPKATVQAAIGGIPLSMNLACGPLVLSFAVASILITAPIGAFAIDHTYKRLLDHA